MPKRKKLEDSDSEPEEQTVRRGPGMGGRGEDVTVTASDSEPEGEAGSDMPFQQLLRIRQDGSTTPAALKARARAVQQANPQFKRKNKHQPAEASSKRPVPVFRDSFQVGSREVRDPRFEDPLSSGAARAEEVAKFKSRYSFLYDEQLPTERKELAVAVKKTKSLARKAELQAELAAVNAQLRAEGERRKRDASARQVKAKEREAVKAGKAPFYLKKSERKRQELISKFEALKAAGQLDRYMEKRRKKNAAKDHRYLPSSRRVQE